MDLFAKVTKATGDLDPPSDSGSLLPDVTTGLSSSFTPDAGAVFVRVPLEKLSEDFKVISKGNLENTENNSDLCPVMKRAKTAAIQASHFLLGRNFHPGRIKSNLHQSLPLPAWLSLLHLPKVDTIWLVDPEDCVANVAMHLLPSVRPTCTITVPCLGSLIVRIPRERILPNKSRLWFTFLYIIFSFKSQIN